MAIIGEDLKPGEIIVGNVMRNMMESKTELKTKGALYVGTGDKTEVTPDDGGAKVLVPKTLHIAPNGASDDGKVLVVDSNETVGWKIKECPKATEATTATTVSTTIGKAKITDIFDDDGTTVKTAKLAKGLQSDTAQSVNGTNWYEFDGTNEYFGSINSPTIIKTLEARPKAEVKSGETTMIKEIALEEDIPQVGEWITVAGTTATLTEAGTYQVIAANMQSIVYWDGSTTAEGIRNTRVSPLGTQYLRINSLYPSITASGILSVYSTVVSNTSDQWAESTTKQSGFKYRKIN